MAVLLSPVGGVAAQFFTNAGVPLSGGKIYTYAAGTSTPQATYTTGAGNIQHSNPIVLDAAGRVPTGEIWLTDGLSYKFVLKDANDVLIATYDNIVGINSNFVNFVNQQEIQTATAGQTVFTLTTMTYQPGTGNLSVFVDGVNQYGPGAQYAYTETSSTVVTFVSGLHVGASVKFTTTQIQNSGVADASQITYTYPAVDAVEQSVEERLAQYVSVKDFGAVGDGVTDDTTAIQNALDSISNGGEIYFPAGIYKVTSTLTVSSDATFIKGSGRGASGYGGEVTSNTSTVVYGYSINGPIFDITGQGCGVQDIAIRGTGMNALTNASALNFQSAVAANTYSLVDNCTVQNTYIGINAQDACLLTISKTQIFDCPYAGVAIANPEAPDTGDMFISDCLFIDSNYYTSAHIYQLSAGGLKVVNCKMLGGNLGYYLPLGTSIQTVDLLFANTSIEQYKESAISLYAPSGTTNFFNNVAITGCEFGSSLATNAAISITSSNQQFQVISITGNIFQIADAPFGITVTDSRCVSISGNAFSSNGGNLGIYLAGASDYIAVVGNTFQYCTSVSNGATGKNIRIQDNISTSSSPAISSTDPLNLPDEGNYFEVTGTTSFSTVYQPTQKGRVVTLKFNGILNVNPGTYLKLAGAFTTSANDTLTLISDGTYWYEIARSANG